MGASWRHAEGTHGSGAGFVHEAFTYSSDETYVEGAVPFVLSGLSAGARVMVAIPAARLGLLREHLPEDDPGLRFEPMDELGRNPAWIISAFADFAASARRRDVRVVNEPIWIGRSAAEVVECQHHEALANLAFSHTKRFALRCAYDASALDPGVLAAAGGTHPVIGPAGALEPSSTFQEGGPAVLPRSPLSPVPAAALTIDFDRATLGLVRRLVEHEAGPFLPLPRVRDLALAAHEAAANSVVHGGGGGRLSTWTADDRLVCEVVGDGTLFDPLAGRVRPAGEWGKGRGLWLIHQVCDLVQLRSTEDGLCVRMHMGPHERVPPAKAPATGPERLR